MNRFYINNQPIDRAALSQKASPAAGAVVTFEGCVRNHNDGQSVTALEYKVFYALAVQEGEDILTEAYTKFGLLDAHAIHREGKLAIGDCAVWVSVAAPHRGEAFAACRYIIDEIKHRLPIWKKEYYTSGIAQWVNCQHDHA